jgi:hypothetical protein
MQFLNKNVHGHQEVGHIDLLSKFSYIEVPEGDAGKLSAYLNTNVELVVGNKNDVFSKQQASGIITDFFRTNKVSSFQLLHKGNKEATSFAIGEIKTNTGNYRVYVLTRKSGNQTVIQQLRIELSND